MGELQGAAYLQISIDTHGTVKRKQTTKSFLTGVRPELSMRRLQCPVSRSSVKYLQGPDRCSACLFPGAALPKNALIYTMHTCLTRDGSLLIETEAKGAEKLGALYVHSPKEAAPEIRLWRVIAKADTSIQRYQMFLLSRP